MYAKEPSYLFSRTPLAYETGICLCTPDQFLFTLNIHLSKQLYTAENNLPPVGFRWKAVSMCQNLRNKCLKILMESVLLFYKPL